MDKSLFEGKITLPRMLEAFIKRWYIVITIMAIFLLSGFIYANFFISPTYSATARMYVFNPDEITSSELSVSTSLAMDFQEIIFDEKTLDQISEELNYEYSAAKIEKTIKIHNPDQTRIIELTSTSENEEIPAKVINGFCNVMPKRIQEIMGENSRLTIISQGATKPIPTQSAKRNALIYSFLIGLGVSLLFLTIYVMSNNKITSEKEIRDGLNINVLATIPYNKNKKGKH